MSEEVSRRWVLKRSSLAGVLGLAGCTTGSEREPAETRTETTAAGVGRSETTGDPTERTTTTTEVTTTAEATTTTKEQTTPGAQTTARDEGTTVVHDHESAEESGFSEEIRAKAKRVGKRVRKSVVYISFAEGRGSGTGWLLDDGSIVTNAHIARQSESFEIETFGGETGTAERVGYHDDMDPDVALLETDLSGVPTLSPGTSSSLSQGQPLVIVGHPGRVGKWVISLGPFREHDEVVGWLLTDAPTNNGNSGSPLVTLDGDVVGCVSGTTFPNGLPTTVSRSEEVFETFPDPEESATAATIEVVQKWVDEWQ